MRVAVLDRPAQGSEPSRITRVPITVDVRESTFGDGAALARTAEPVTMGLPFPRGLCVDPRVIAIVSGGPERAAPHVHERAAVQVRVLDRWPDGSIRWALLDFRAETTGRGPSR